jgi:MFS family permease
VAVGVTAALQFLPIMLFGAWGGVLADRWPKRSLLIVTQTLMVAPALALWALTASGAVLPWMVFALVFVRGSVNAIDNPTRQSFVIEMVGADRVVNAVGLNSVLIHSARILGPAGAGILIATLGVAPCFLINAATFAAMIVALRGMDPRHLSAPAVDDRDPGGVRDALRYVRGEPGLLIPLVMMAVAGTLAFNFQVLLPLLGRFTFDGGAGAYTALAVAMAIGSVGGALATGARGRVSDRLIAGSAVAFGVFSLLAAAAPSLPLALIALVPLGAMSVTFAAGVNSTLQLDARPAMRGRVMALYSVVFLGSTPIGAPIVGALAEFAGPRSGLVLAGVAALAAGIGGAIAFARSRDPDFSALESIRGASTAARLGFGLSASASRTGLGGRRWGRLGDRSPVAIEAGGTDQLHRLEGGRGLDVEAHAVAVLDRDHGVLAAAPGERDQDRVAGADRGDLRGEPAGDPGEQGEGADRPESHEGDPAGALGGQAGRGARPCKQPRGRLRAPRRTAEPDTDHRGGYPPAGRERERKLVGVLVGDHDADRPERGRNPRHQ